MNGKIKAIAVVALILGVIASTIYIAPALAYSNDTTDQSCDRVMERIQYRNCECDGLCECDQNQNQNQNQNQQQEQTLNQPNNGLNWQYCYEHQYRHQNMP